MPFSQAFDVILLRNVMLYFGKDTRTRLLEHVHSLMAGDSVLMLGVGEQATDSSRWAPVLSGGTSYYRPVGKNRE